MDNNHPLVSVLVVTYNAGEYICETLDSIKSQTYDNIELIVSDDHSSDETVQLANEWIEKNKERFARTVVLHIDCNTGVSANYNRAVGACRGEWIKNVDGDDLLCDNCVEDNIKYISEHPECKLVFSNVSIFSGSMKKRRMHGLFFNDEKKKIFQLEAFEQFKMLLHSNILPSQSAFIKSEILKSHPYNEDYKGLEDAPMWVYLTRDGIKAHYFDTCTALYRRAESMTLSSSRFFSNVYFESVQKFFWREKIDYIRKYHLENAYSNCRKELFLMEFVDVFLRNRRTFINKAIFRSVRLLIMRFATFKL